MIVLNWLRSESASFKPFVGVRVAEIQATWSSCLWRYVPSDDNPADDLSRGITVREMCQGRWMNGPPFLSRSKAEWPSENKEELKEQTEDPEKRKSSNTVAAILRPQPLIDPERFSSWEKLIRITAYCQRFANNFIQKKKDPTKMRGGELKHK